jgi:TatD DNase family protein
MIDTHCHLYAEQFDSDRDEMIRKAIEAGVTHFLLPNIDEDTFDPLYNLCDKYPASCFPMMGLHPTSVGRDYKKNLDMVYKQLDNRSFIAIGEIGLDYYWDTSHKAAQLEVFEKQLRWASELKLPVAIHTRSSFDDTYKLVEKIKQDGLTGVFHCFSGTQEDAEKIMTIDFFMGIGGVLTFKNGGIDKVLPDIPMAYIIMETDSPYLAPVPYRGKRNEPKYLALVLQKLAEIKNITKEEADRITTENAKTLFRLS